MTFANPSYLFILVFIPVIIILFAINRKTGKQRLLKLGKPEFVKQMMPAVSESRMWVKFSLLLAALTMLVFAIARPQIGMHITSKTTSGIEVVVALDVSNSMLANDVQPTRMEKAKAVVSSLCNRLTEDKIALVVFAGNAFLQMPMSADNVSVGMFLEDINTGMIPTQGTSIAQALSVSSKSFSRQKDVKRAVVVITDGEDHEGGVESVLSDLQKQGVKVFVMGIGSTEGSRIFVDGQNMLDADGNEVVTRLNESMCQNIAKMANGTYIHIDDSNSAQDQLVSDLNSLQKSRLDNDAYDDYYELYPWFTLLALIFIILEVIILPQRSHYFDSWNIFSNMAKVYKDKGTGLKTSGSSEHLVKSNRWSGISTVILAFSLLALTSCVNSSTKVMTHKGNQAYDKHQDSLAIINYNIALALDTTNSKALFNLGNTYLRGQNTNEALARYEQSAKQTNTPILKARAYHNIGLLHQLSQKYDEAIASYKESLRADPTNDNTRYNLALCQYLKDKNPQQNQQNQPDQQNKNQDQQNKEQDKNNQNQQNKNQQDKQDNNNKSDQQQSQSSNKNQDISKENAEQILRAAQMKERETQDKLNRKRLPMTRRQLEKNW